VFGDRVFRTILGVFVLALALLTPLSASAAKPGGGGVVPNSVCVDAGHGGGDSGAVSGGIAEKDLNLEVATDLYGLLVANGYTAVMTRTGDSDLDGATRAAICNNAHAALLLSVHHNSAATATTDYSLGCWQNKNAQAWARTLSAATAAAAGIPDHGLYQLANSMLIHANMPAAISEGYFLTNADEQARLNDAGQDYRMVEAQALYGAAANYLASH
jgi:N-acetylmuramoyl-L-alanine amidase